MERPGQDIRVCQVVSLNFRGCRRRHGPVHRLHQEGFYGKPLAPRLAFEQPLFDKVLQRFHPKIVFLIVELQQLRTG